MSNEDDLRKLMIKNTIDEMDELEKGIVLASIEIDKMQPNTDLFTSSQIRLRREQLEEEWEKAKKRLEDLRGGKLPSADKAREKLQKARYNMMTAKDSAGAIEDKQKAVQDHLYEGDDNG